MERGINGRETPKTFPACVKGCVLCIFQKGRLVKRGIACRFQGKLTHGSSVGRPLSVLACRHSAWDDEQLQKEGRRIVHSSLRPHLRCDTLPSPLSTSPPQQKKGAVTSHDNLAWFYILFFSFFLLEWPVDKCTHCGGSCVEQAYRKLLSAFANTCPLHRHLLFDWLFWKLFCFPASTPCWTMNHDDVEQAALRLPRGHDNKKKGAR